MKMKEILARIDERLKEKGLKAATVSRQATGSPDTIRNWRRAVKDGRDAGASTRTLTAIAEAFSLSYDELFGEAAPISVPVISMVSAGNLRDQPGVTAADIERWIQVADLPAGEWIALGVEGDSMNRIAPDGSTIIVNRADDRLLDGKYYVFSLEGGEATFKRYKRKPEALQPFSTNPDHMSIAVSGDLYVFGRARRVITDL